MALGSASSPSASTGVEPWQLDLRGAWSAIAEGELSAAELLETSIARIEAVEPSVHAWAHLDPDLARAQLDALRPGPMHGIPVGVKDIFNTVEMPCGMGSPVWADFRPGNDARVVHYARMAGSVVVGKTVTAEFAVHAPGPTRNPYDTSRSPGTSSSGSAVAVATGMVPWALGSQTAGSIVRPASYCGVYGFKPSYGVIARTGMLKTTDTLDSVGWFTRSAGDLPLLLDILRVRGADYPMVHATLDRDERAPERHGPLRVAVLDGGLPRLATPTSDVSDGVAAFAATLSDLGLDVSRQSAPAALADAHDVHGTIYDRCIAYYFQKETEEHTLVSQQIHEMVERGRRTTLATYGAALDRQTEIQREFAAWSEGFDLLLAPSTAGPAPGWDDPEPADSALVWTLCGAPVVSLPVLAATDGLPVGIQAVGPRYADYRLLRALIDLAQLGVLPDVLPVTPPAG